MRATSIACATHSRCDNRYRQRPERKIEASVQHFVDHARETSIASVSDTAAGRGAAPTKPGDLHLGVQYVRHMGFVVAAIARGADKTELAKKLAAHHYIDSALPRLCRRSAAPRLF
jgi:hypothetical protein